MEQKRYEKAVEEFEKARRSSPENKVIRENLAVAYNRLAVDLMERGHYLEARGYLEKAVELKPDEGKIRDNLAVAYEKMATDERERRLASQDAKEAGTSGPGRPFTEEDAAKEKISRDFIVQAFQAYEKKEYDLAKESLAEALKYSRRNPMAFELAGDIAYYEQDLKAAKENYVEAYRLQNAGRVKSKLEKVSREVPVEGKLDQYGDEHFIIRYKKDVPENFGGGYEIRQFLRKAWKAISNDFGIYPKDKVVILLYSEDEYRYLSDSPAWVSGHFDGKIRLPAYKDKMRTEDLNKIIWHELTHYFVHELSRGTCPKWLNEGLAQYEENKVKPIDLGYFREAVKKKKIIPLEELDRGIEGLSDETGYVLFYQQSFMVVSRLVEKYRMFKMKEMLQAYGKGETTERAFNIVLKTSLKAFELQWLASIERDKA